MCTSNVCRSPAGAVMLQRGVDFAGLAEQVEVGSAGTEWGSEGQPIDPRILLALERADYDEPAAHAARIVHQSELTHWDLVLAMTAAHAETMQRKVDALPAGAPRPQVLLWRQFDPVAPANADPEELAVEDPWYKGQRAFDRTVLVMQRCVPSIVLHLRMQLAARR